MPGKFEAPRGGSQPPRRRRRRKRSQSRLILMIAAVLLLVVMALVLSRCFGGPDTPDAPDSTSGNTLSQSGETTETVPQVVSTATIGAQGDLLMHKLIFGQEFDAVCYQSDGTYNFESIFRYLTPYTSALDYAAANLETTFGGDDFPYQGNPSFNCPDALADAVADAGFDMLLTANNHSYDTLMTGLNRTLEHVRGKGLDTLGTRLSEEEPRYSIVDVNGIKIGMVCYTYTMAMSGGKPSLNNNSPVENPEQINYFSYDNLDKLYTEVETILGEMEAEGAEATMLYIHWGTEYEIEENEPQNVIAQKMCDLGIDVIVGGHPHVVQPMELLSSTTDPEHKTVCIYSLGNAVSNQRIEEMRLKTGHTEDGVLFSVTFEKYSDGSVYLAGANVLPTWVNMHANNGGREYNILPLEDSRREEWQTLFQLTDDQYSNAQKSYDRTMAILETGLTECQTYLNQAKADRAP